MNSLFYRLNLSMKRTNTLLAYKTAFRAFSYLRMRNPAVYISTLFSTANHSSLESQVELTGMLSSREQNPFPIPLRNKQKWTFWTTRVLNWGWHEKRKIWKSLLRIVKDRIFHGQIHGIGQKLIKHIFWVNNSFLKFLLVLIQQIPKTIYLFI